ncbi:MAG: hypothetical protein WDZ59_04955 [Pirellulales bacterium]
MPTEHARERLKHAVGILVDEPGPICERLLTAYVSHLATLDTSELPHSVAAELERIKIELSESEVPGDTGTASGQVRAMDDRQASRTARKIYEMFLESLEMGPYDHEHD